MKLLRLTIAYPEYLNYFYGKQTGLAQKSFPMQQEQIHFDAFAWADFWGQALRPKGYEVFEVITNAMPMQMAWWREFGNSSEKNPSEIDIAVAQVKKFAPDILWFDHISLPLLQKIRVEIPKIRLVVGWLGGTVLNANFVEYVDVLFSCAQETVDYFRSKGKKAEQLHHAFDPRILERIANRGELHDFIFIGQIVRSQNFHNYRMQLLEEMVNKTKLEIFSPSADISWLDDTKIRLRGILYDVFQIAQKMNLEQILEKMPVFNKVSKWQYKPLPMGNTKLKQAFRKPVFGLDMYQAIKNSKIVLNIHADGSSKNASNMRLFETTGVGACLLTDWKQNMAELFEPDKEVVTYKSLGECLEKVHWLLDNPKVCQEIARAGQKRTLSQHTFTQRADRLDALFQEQI